MLSESRSRLLVLVLVAWLLAASASSTFAGTQPPGQPYASYWFPSTILDWSPATDPDAPFNRSGVPLATRFQNPDLNVNPHAIPGEAGIASLVAFAPTSFNPSQGTPTIDYYALNYWQYVDQLVFWGGSAGEGLILAPNPSVIDAGHRNGVPVLGNVYLPPVAFGGQIQWVEDFVQRDGDAFPVADKMIEAANYYGFDGWFINQETEGGNAQLADDMQAMLVYFHAHSNLRIVWYDAMAANGQVNYQNALDAQNQMFFQDGSKLVSDDMFLNFNWTTTGLANSSTLATSLGRSPYELYAGIDVQSNGYGTAVNWNALFPEGSPQVTSIGFYRPEWTFASSSSPSDFYARDNHFWVGPNHDPSNTTTGAAWKGLANYVPATSPITTLPFVTNFNTGQGYVYAIDGDVLNISGGWNNLSLQDVLPTWRWIMRSEGTALTPSLDWNLAYWGGTSLLVTGTLDAINDLTLYEMNLPIDANTMLEVTYLPQAGSAPSHMQVGLSFADAPFAFEYVDVGTASDGGWQTPNFPLDAYAGRSLAVVSLRFVPDAVSEDYVIHVGRLGFYEAPLTTPNPPSDVEVISKNETSPDNASLRLSWTASPGPVNSYNVLQRHPDGSLTWLGGTPNTAYFVQSLVRNGNEATSTIEVEAVSPGFVRSSAATATVAWDTIFGDGFDGAAAGARRRD